MIPASYISYCAPEILISVWAMFLLLLEAFTDLPPRVVSTLALVNILFTAGLTLCISSTNPDGGAILFWGGMCKWDGAAKFFDLFFLAVVALVIWMNDEVQAPVQHAGGEFVILPLFTTVGLMLLASANDFMLLFIALELVTISFYILVAYQRRNVVALEAGVKYLILGGLSSAFLVMGVAYIFGITGHSRFDLIWRYFHYHELGPALSLGLLLVLAGVGFKVAMVPFHSWAPDVYEGAPNSITAFLSVGSKAGGLIILMRIVLGVFDNPAAAAIWIPLLTFCAIASLILGNFSAIPQRNLKRMLGYSSIGHTGFMLVAVIGASVCLTGKVVPFYTENAYGQITVEVYLISYLLATFAAFIVLAILERRLPGLEIHHLAGLSQRSPLLAATLALSLISMAGVPPLSGFIAKFYVILVAWHQGLHLLLTVVIVAAIAAFYYYLNPIKSMYWSEPLDDTPIRLNRVTSGVLIGLCVLLLVTGFWAQSMFSLVDGALLGDNGPEPVPTAVAVVQH